jgi:hypothetical protein
MKIEYTKTFRKLQRNPEKVLYSNKHLQKRKILYKQLTIVPQGTRKRTN